MKDVLLRNSRPKHEQIITEDGGILPFGPGQVLEVLALAGKKYREFDGLTLPRDSEHICILKERNEIPSFDPPGNSSRVRRVSGIIVEQAAGGVHAVYS